MSGGMSSPEGSATTCARSSLSQWQTSRQRRSARSSAYDGGTTAVTARATMALGCAATFGAANANAAATVLAIVALDNGAAPEGRSNDEDDDNNDVDVEVADGVVGVLAAAAGSG